MECQYSILQKMNEDKKQMLLLIATERMKIKSRLNLLSYFANENKLHEKEINKLLERLKYLEELEEKIKNKSN